MARLLVTGANGFVGRALCERLVADGHDVVGLVRRADTCPRGVHEWVLPGDDFAGVDAAWPHDAGIDAVIHLAARVHVMHDASSDPLAAYRATNVEGTMRLARTAARSGVRRFVFLSSIKALGEGEPARRPWREDDRPAPVDPYGESKLEAEHALAALCASPEGHGMEWAVLRPPLVYGPGVKVNFLRLLQAVDRGIPLPVGLARAPRSLVYVGNLADAAAACALLPGAAGQVFHVCDGEDLSVSALVSRMGRALGRRSRQVPVPVALLRLLGRLTGRTDEIDRLVSSLRLDAAKLRDRLQWTPPFTVDAGLAATVGWHRRQRG